MILEPDLRLWDSANGPGIGVAEYAGGLPR